MLPESTTAVVARNVTWHDGAATEPYEAGWAREAVVFVRSLKGVPASQGRGQGRIEISADGMHWVAEGTEFPLPTGLDEVTFARVRHFGNWLRVAASLPDGATLTVLVALHLKA